jgi:Transcription factor WhiB
MRTMVRICPPRGEPSQSWRSFLRRRRRRRQVKRRGHSAATIAALISASSTAVYRSVVAIEAALQVCAACPVLARCREWVLSLRPAERPTGVVGGLVIGWRGRRRHGSGEVNGLAS